MEYRYTNESSALESEHELQVFNLQEVQGLIEQGYTAIPLIEKLELRESAGALYDRLRGSGPSFLLESSDPAEHQGRYSFIGVEQETIIRLEAEGMMVDGVAHTFDDPYDFVNERITNQTVAPVAGLPPFFGGAVGLFGYDLAQYREPTIGEAKPDQLDLPDMALIVPRVVIALDGYKQETSIINTLLIEPDADEGEVAASYRSAVEAIQAMKQRIIDPVEPTTAVPTSYDRLDFGSNMGPEVFKDAVQTAKDSAEAGDIFQAVPSQRFSSEQTVNSDFAHEVFNKLKRLNPSRYAFLFEFGDFQVAGCSPETLVKVTDGYVEHMAIAGTKKRGQTAEADAILAQELKDDPKERAEHSMLVDLCRNDMNRVCDPSSVVVETHAAVENYSHVMHMTSKIHGRLSDTNNALDALASIAPAGTLSGAPKISAMQLIDRLEPDKRGFYGGAVGYITPKGDLDSCIFIRSIVVDKDGRVHVQAGAGVVADSDPQSELEETIMKAQAPMQAIQEVCKPSLKRQQLLEAEEQASPPDKSARRIGSRVLLLDNYDSYTYNVRQYLVNLGAEVVVMRNDVPVRELIQAKPDFLVVSPGPHTPREAGLSVEAMRYFPEHGVPSLGICLGHQALAAAFGGEVERHKAVHGKLSAIEHDGRTIFEGLPNPLKAMRYHSLVANMPLPDALERSAFVVEGDGQKITMAIRHTQLPAEGVQFHPESFYTPSGSKILENFLQVQP
jgi:anthranilate synthase component 1